MRIRIRIREEDASGPGPSPGPLPPRPNQTKGPHPSRGAAQGSTPRRLQDGHCRAVPPRTPERQTPAIVGCVAPAPSDRAPHVVHHLHQADAQSHPWSVAGVCHSRRPFRHGGWGPPGSGPMRRSRHCTPGPHTVQDAVAPSAVIAPPSVMRPPTTTLWYSLTPACRRRQRPRVPIRPGRRRCSNTVVSVSPFTRSGHPTSLRPPVAFTWLSSARIATLTALTPRSNTWRASGTFSPRPRSWPLPC
ncbi:hypothetical protein DWB77_07371 [Streptomyces hundungensis]|uniref:Uncharacterized protein n=1 Tax=Streptomyces hundungensis TaxID=1077946 RepID=A0A387HNM8_9ACTN|nr:hypothetical protein DWB77_07371 [Streptomyces hundungensis]